MFLDSVARRPETPEADLFPWTLPLFRDLPELRFSKPVTFLVGENGSGKSTLLEGLAVGMSAAAAGRQDLGRDDSLEAARRLAAGLVMRRRRHARNRHFIRAEDVFGFVLRIKAEIDKPTDPFSRGQFMARYGENPDARSHGETFLHLLEGWVATTGLYFLDEPETPLSPQRVLALMALIKDRVAEGSQFIIATHSPILMAQPDSEILLFEDSRISSVAYDDLEHVKLTRQFLADPSRFLRHL
jgi:predicted ATPase